MMGFLANCILWMQPHYVANVFHCLSLLFSMCFISFHCFFQCFSLFFVGFFNVVHGFHCFSMFFMTSLFFIVHYVFQCFHFFSICFSVCHDCSLFFQCVSFSSMFFIFSLLVFFIVLHEHVGPTWSNLNWALVSFSSDSAVLDGTWKPSTESFWPKIEGTQ